MLTVQASISDSKQRKKQGGKDSGTCNREFIMDLKRDRALSERASTISSVCSRFTGLFTSFELSLVSIAETLGELLELFTDPAEISVSIIESASALEFVDIGTGTETLCTIGVSDCRFLDRDRDMRTHICSSGEAC